MKKEKYKTLLLWGIVAYTVAILMYFTLKVFDQSADFISAFGSILSALATFFAAFVAAYLFNYWKDEKEYDLKTNCLIKCIDRAKSIEIDLILISTVIENLRNIENFKVLKFEYTQEQLHILNNLFYYHSEIKTYSKISKKEELINDYNALQISLLALNGLYKQLILELYAPYFQKFNNEHGISQYLVDEKKSLEYSRIVDFFNKGTKVQTFNKNGVIELEDNNAKIADYLKNSQEKINKITEKLDDELGKYLSNKNN